MKVIMGRGLPWRWIWLRRPACTSIQRGPGLGGTETDHAASATHGIPTGVPTSRCGRRCGPAGSTEPQRTAPHAGGQQLNLRGRAQGDDWQGDRASEADGSDRRSVLRSLLHAAGMAVGEQDTGAMTAGDRWRSLPLVQMFDTPVGLRYCAVTAVDDRGRVCDRTPLKVLGWGSGTPVTIVMLPAAGVAVVRRGGAAAVTRQGHLRIPADLRHGLRIGPGDRLLVVAHPADDVLVAYTPSAIDAMVASYHTSICAPDDP
jgi:hypothetical protein